MEGAGVPSRSAVRRFAETLGRAGFEIWKRKPPYCLEAAETLGHRRSAGFKAGYLLLDEPTNHLDLAGIEWLESLLHASPFACWS